MASLYPEDRLPGIGGWKDRHSEALKSLDPFESSITGMLCQWHTYAVDHEIRYNSLIGDDGVLGPVWVQIGRGIQQLLNGELGRLDAGTLDKFINDVIHENGADEEE